jgi:two-component system, OmpR family, sensor histidine kinase QseC
VRQGSIRRRLLWLLLAALSAAWITSAGLAYHYGHREADALLDAHLRQSARLLAKAAHDVDALEVDEDEDDDDDDLDRYRTGVAYQVWSTEGRLLLRSENAPRTPLSGGAHGFKLERSGGVTWRVYTGRPDHGVIVHVGEDHATRERIARRIALSALTPMLIALPLLGLAIGWIVRRALRPLDALGDEISRRDANDLAPVAPGPVPAELAPLVARLDELFQRIRDSLDSERRFTSHAAHELRTPVAGLRAQAEVAATTPDPAVRKAALQHCIEACDRIARLVTQLLLLARADELDSIPEARPCRLDVLAREVLAELVPEAGFELELEAVEEPVVPGDPELLSVLVRNLVDNALRHGRGKVSVMLRRDASTVTLIVEDEGPGVPDEGLPRLGGRFYRASTARGTGSGLGLSIVSRIAELHHGSVQFENRVPQPGFRVSVTLPRASARGI